MCVCVCVCVCDWEKLQCRLRVPVYEQVRVTNDLCVKREAKPNPTYINARMKEKRSKNANATTTERVRERRALRAIGSRMQGVWMGEREDKEEERPFAVPFLVPCLRGSYLSPGCV